jgi:hypothetical protein
MAITIFYSWQSDLPNRLNRTFIEQALEKAIKRVGEDMEIQEALRDEVELDKDTKGIPGTPPIVEVIFNKISNSGIFVPDLTFVGKSVGGRLLPNPNVLIEYGWALKALSYSRIISVMNSAFGEPTTENKPFNMRHLRNPITYHLGESAGQEERVKIKENLANDLYEAIKIIVESGILTQSNESQKEFEAVPFTSNPSTFLQLGETFIDDRPFHSKNKVIMLPEGQRLFLRLFPKKPMDNIRSSKVALDLCKTGNLIPMCDLRNIPGYSYGRNKYGAYVFHEDDGKISNFTQLFKSGELWGIDAQCIDKKDQMVKVEFGYFPCVSLEDIFIWTLNNYLKFANDVLEISLPLKFIAGATDVLGYRMTPPPGMNFTGFERFAGNVFEDHIVFNGIIKDYSQKAQTILRPFFEYVWEECGLKRPDKESLDR